jgi:hypothetical protein
MEEEQGIPDRTPDDHSPDRHEELFHRAGLREPLEELRGELRGCQKQRYAGEYEDETAHRADRYYEFHCVPPQYPVPPSWRSLWACDAAGHARCRGSEDAQGEHCDRKEGE